MHLSQAYDQDGRLRVILRDGTTAHVLSDYGTTLDLAHDAIARKLPLTRLLADAARGPVFDLDAAATEGRIALPISHPDPAHMHLTGTGLTHLGSASTRNAMHAADKAEVTDSMKMFRLGLEGGKPQPGAVGAQPEWFYKGTGVAAVPGNQPIASPDFALDGGEEPEIAGIYLIGPEGTPYRLGFALANEFSDHVTERLNYLQLAHSKLRPASFGPEILVGALPRHIAGRSRVLRGADVIFDGEFLSGEDNMSYSLANLEHHHFKYEIFRQPGDLHVHMFGTATLSFGEGVRPRDGDVFEISAPEFGLPLRNTLRAAPQPVEPLMPVTPL